MHVLNKMSEPHATKSKPASSDRGAFGWLFLLEVSGGRIHSMRPDGSDRKVVVADSHLPDGVAIDVEAGHVYWTNMGLSPATNDGSIERADLDGGNRRIIVPAGSTYTPKQVQLDKENGKLYWSDREGMRVMRANLDGSLIETLVETGRGDADRRDQSRWCVGIAIDPVRKQIYWTQKGPDNGEQGRLLRAGLDIPKGETAANRCDCARLGAGIPEETGHHLPDTEFLRAQPGRGAACQGEPLRRERRCTRRAPGNCPHPDRGEDR
jgi:hypothetical protein